MTHTVNQPIRFVAICACALSLFTLAPASAQTGDSLPAVDRASRLCTAYSGTPARSGEEPPGMVFVRGGTFLMGSNLHYPEEQPPRYATVSGFWIDRTEVTNAQFAAFVAATGYKTIAERGLDKKDYPDLPPEALVPGSMVFSEPPKDARIRMDVTEWWRYVPGADWRHPDGPNSSIAGRDNHPVVHIAYADAEAYTKWLGRSLPTEAEWEYAARAGSRTRYHSGDDPQSLLKAANTFDADAKKNWPQWREYALDSHDGFAFTAPVGSFAPNAFGLHDMHGNAWEWCADWHDDDYYAKSPVDDPTGPAAGSVRVRRGGSWHTWSLYARSSYRNWNTPQTRYPLVGIRLVREAGAEER
jgi:formylglycine-generating enzyme required for sulfatase activity